MNTTWLSRPTGSEKGLRQKKGRSLPHTGKKRNKKLTREKFVAKTFWSNSSRNQGAEQKKGSRKEKKRSYKKT